MKNLVAILMMVGSFVLYSRHLFRSRENIFSHESFIEHEIDDQRQRVKRKRRRYNNSKYRPRIRYRNKRLKLQGSHPKAHRFSNHHTLRRMYRST